MRLTRMRTAAALAALTFLAACGDARLDKLALGISKDSAAAVIGDTPHRSLSYLTAGKNWEIQLYARTQTDAKDSVPWRKLSPVVFISGKAVGWGWGWWGREAAKQKIPMPGND